MSQILGLDDFLYKKNIDAIKDYDLYIRTFNNAQR